MKQMSVSLVCPTCGNKVILRVLSENVEKDVHAWCASKHLRPVAMEVTRKAHVGTD